MKALLWILSGLVLIAAAYFAWQAFTPPAPPPAPAPAPQVQRQPIPAPGPTTGIAHPLPEPAPPTPQESVNLGLDRPLPKLEESDGRLRELLGQLLPGKRLQNFFFLDHFVRRLVLLIDSLPRNALPTSRLPNRPVAGKFLVTGSDDTLVVDPANAKRYTPWVNLAEAADPKAVVAVYVYLYPLFQQAYQDLGYPHGYFNDRLIEAIDNLLVTPEPKGPLHLVRPKILYLYADVDFESRSAGQKILLRIGPKNAERIKALLRVYRKELVTANVPAPK